MKKLISVLLASSLLIAVTSAYAADSDPTIATIKQNLKNNLPDLVIDQITTTPFNGVYEVDSGRKVFYVDSSGNYGLVGNLLDLKNKVSLTEERTTELNRIDWSKLPLDLAIKRVRGTGASRIAIFTDPDCPFCHRLEAETIPYLKNVTIYYYLYPLAIHANAEKDSKRILCAENPESAMVSFMAKGADLGNNITCLSGTQRLPQMMAVGNNVVQVTGTPTIILPNGRIVSGLVPADYLMQLIDQNQPESAATSMTVSK
jgi:thiol:disulfide interchange protein DsbC